MKEVEERVIGQDEVVKFIQNLFGNLKRSLGRPKYRWENNVKIAHTGVRYEGVDWK